MDTNHKTVLVVLSTIFYCLGICTYITSYIEVFTAICALLLCIFIFSKIVKPKYALALFFIFCLGFFNIKHSVKTTDELANTHANNTALEGRVESIPNITKDGTRAKFYLNVKRAQIYSKIYDIKDSKTIVTVNDPQKSFENIQIGDKIRIKGNLRAPKSAKNPSQFDYARYLKYRNTFSILYSNGKNFKILEKPQKKELWWYILQKTDSTRDEIINKHAKHVKSPQLEILGGIVFGNEAINPPDEIKQSFINSGLLHLLAASGLNVALIFGIWWFLAQNLRLPYTISIWGGVFFIILYTFMTGFPPSILRASIMLLFVLFGKLIDREAKPVALIFFVGLIMLLFEPKMFLDVGFQLSFVVTIGLICTIEPISARMSGINKNFIKRIKNLPKPLKLLLMCFSPGALLTMVLVPLCAQLYVAPLQMYYFNTFTPWSLFANLCVVPFIGIISFFGFISSIFALIPYLGLKFIALFDITINPFLVLLVKISGFFSNLKYSILTTPSPSVIQMFIFWGILILLAENIKTSFKSKKFLYALAVCIFIFCITFIKIPEKDFEILVFDVGNADAILLKTPKNKYIMIDTAKAPFHGISDAKAIIGEYFKDKNIKELEILIVTHFDTDHCGGVKYILDNFKVKTVYIQNSSPDEISGRKIIDIMKNKNINYKTAQNNSTIYQENNFKLKTYTAKIKSGADKDKLDNENSIVTLAESNGIKALFMADCGVLGYNDIKILPRDITILKVGHHGAKNSVNKEMLEKFKPRYSIISSGYNTYGHPAYETLKALRESGSEIFITRDEGALKISKCKNKTCTAEHFENGFKQISPQEQ